MIVTRIRMVPTGEVDRFGKPITAPVETLWDAYGFAPGTADDVSAADGVQVTDRGTLYFRGTEVPDSITGDRWKFFGAEFGADGHESQWHNTRGQVVGCTVVVKRIEVTHG